MFIQVVPPASDIISGMKHLCQECGVSFFRNGLRQRKYCSRKCLGKSLSKKQIRTCLHCGSNFEVSQWSLSVGQGKYCSLECSSLSKRKRIQKSCKICSSPFEVTPCQIRNGEGFYCSNKCRGEARRKAFRSCGSLNLDHSYVWIYIDGKTVLEHRYLVEKKIERALSHEETVHHINGDKSDNRICNLYLFSTRKDHQRYHSDLAFGNKELVLVSNL